jgi:hypothetical protein
MTLDERVSRLEETIARHAAAGMAIADLLERHNHDLAGIRMRLDLARQISAEFVKLHELADERMTVVETLQDFWIDEKVPAEPHPAEAVQPDEDDCGYEPCAVCEPRRAARAEAEA